MPVGPGSYSDLAKTVQRESEADGVVVVIVNGNGGSGTEVFAMPEVLAELPTLLRHLADEIEHAEV
jgi:hypothetical protein